MTRPPCYNECFAFIKEVCEQTGVDIAAGLCPDIFVSPPGFPPFTVYCPHGVRWLAEPTGDQRAKWAKDRTP